MGAGRSLRVAFGRKSTSIPTRSAVNKLEGQITLSNDGEEGLPMSTPVMRRQFEFKDGSIIHTPTGAEFTPVKGTEDSTTIWTGDVGRRLPSGEIYRYADVMAVIKLLRHEIVLAS